jgi:hypothetical protein
MSAWSGHTEPTGPGCRPVRAGALTGVGRSAPQKTGDGFRLPDEAKGKEEA